MKNLKASENAQELSWLKSMDDYKIDVTYMVDGCGKKIPETRMVTVRKDGTILYQERTQRSVEEILKGMGIQN